MLLAVISVKLFLVRSVKCEAQIRSSYFGFFKSRPLPPFVASQRRGAKPPQLGGFGVMSLRSDEMVGLVFALYHHGSVIIGMKHITLTL